MTTGQEGKLFLNVEGAADAHQSLASLVGEGKDLYAKLNKIVYEDLPEVWKSQQKDAKFDTPAEETIKGELPKIWAACEQLEQAFGSGIQTIQEV